MEKPRYWPLPSIGSGLPGVRLMFLIMVPRFSPLLEPLTFRSFVMVTESPSVKMVPLLSLTISSSFILLPLLVFWKIPCHAGKSQHPIYLLLDLGFR